jgi:hypothetical protein
MVGARVYRMLGTLITWWRKPPSPTVLNKAQQLRVICLKTKMLKTGEFLNFREPPWVSGSTLGTNNGERTEPYELRLPGIGHRLSA